MSENDTELEIKKARKKKIRIRRIRKAIGYILFILIVGSLIYFWSFHTKNDRFPWQPPVNVQVDSVEKTTTVRLEKYFSKIDISGFFEAYDTQEVVMRASGAIEEVLVKEGDRVKKGQLVARIDSSNQEYGIADLESRIKETKLTGNASNLRLLEMQLDTAKKNLDYTKAYANFDGVVVQVNVDEGDYSTAGDKLMIIIDDSKLKATVEVDEIDVGLLKENMVCALTSDSVKSGEFEGKISYIPMIGRYTTSGIGVMDVEIVVENVPDGLKPGFSFEGTVTAESEQQMLLVDQVAVTTVNSISTVSKKNENGEIESIPVQVKFLGEGVYQIVQGDVKEGDVLVYHITTPAVSGQSGFSMMGPGTTIRNR